MTLSENGRFKEILVFVDDQSWVWELASSTLEHLQATYVRLPSSTSIRPSWQRFKSARRIIIHWENKGRGGGATVEEILDIAPGFDVGERVIILTTNPTHEDVVYFSELGITRIMRLRQREKELAISASELEGHVTHSLKKDPQELSWRKALFELELLPVGAEFEKLDALERRIDALQNPLEKPSARYLDAKAQVLHLRRNGDEALKLWNAAIDRNPNYFRTYNNLINYYRSIGKLREAHALMQKMQSLNGLKVSRLVQMGEIHVELKEDERAEHYFNLALSRDTLCSGALNGMAEIRFRQGHLDESRKLLEKSSLAYKIAAELNTRGIEMVRTSKYREALDLYTKAQYVLPQQEKGPMLFYNIGLCYSRWGKEKLAREFLKIALIKEPNYKKAQKLLEQLEQKEAAAKAS